MSNQDEIRSPRTNSFVPSGNNVLLDGGASVAGEGHLPKIRKPYTITKQRERWTEEEHKKFLEALKLYGRAWRKIEELVGTKTAVQIRSHAQKFFSKVVRETNNSNASSVEPIEIPPPRPKRKPMHPYPRKVALPSGKESATEQRGRSVSPNSSLSEQENQSPTSVLSAVVSDNLGSADSTTPNGSPPTISSADVSDKAAFVPNEETTQQEDAPSVAVSVKLELFPNVDAFDKEESVSPKVLKLFGKDVVISNKQSDPSRCMSKSPPSDTEGEVENPMPMNITNEISENLWNPCDDRVNTNHVEKPIPLPWWVFFKGMPIAPFECDVGDGEDKETQRDRSSAGSNSGSVNGEANVDKNWDFETESDQSAAQSEEPTVPGKTLCFLEKRASFDNGIKGFVPYKRCLSDREMQSSSLSTEARESQRIRLCL